MNHRQNRSDEAENNCALEEVSSARHSRCSCMMLRFLGDKLVGWFFFHKKGVVVVVVYVFCLGNTTGVICIGSTTSNEFVRVKS